jgi:hypothetical protein
MGVWDETCGITRFPIFTGDECVLVVVDRKAVEGGNTELGAGDLVHVRAVHRGTYSGYGWVDEVEEDAARHDIDVMLFFHRSAWDRVVGDGPAWSKAAAGAGAAPAGTTIGADDATALLWVMKFADRTRRDLYSATLFRGAQDYRSLGAYEVLDELTRERMARHREHYEERE